MKPDPHKIVSGIVKVAALPMVYVKLSEALKNPKTSNKDLEVILSEDAALASRVLRLVNSALYSFPSRIDTISRAVTIMGQQQLHDIVLACSFINLFNKLPQDIVNMESFWRHSIACGIASRIVAVLRREQNVERFFIAGLLHDIGRLILYMELPEQAQSILLRAREEGELLYKTEHAALGFHHAMLGALLLKHWKLPDSLVEAVACHHAPKTARRYKVEASIVHLADIICHVMQLGTSGECFVPALDQAAWSLVDIQEDAVPNLLDQLGVQSTEAVTFIMGEVA